MYSRLSMLTLNNTNSLIFTCVWWYDVIGSEQKTQLGSLYWVYFCFFFLSPYHRLTYKMPCRIVDVVCEGHAAVTAAATNRKLTLWKLANIIWPRPVYILVTNNIDEWSIDTHILHGSWLNRIIRKSIVSRKRHNKEAFCCILLPPISSVCDSSSCGTPWEIYTPLHCRILHSKCPTIWSRIYSLGRIRQRICHAHHYISQRI